MDAVKFIKEKKRMCEPLICCVGCELGYHKHEADMDCATYVQEYPKQAVAIVEKWSQEHPQKTMLSDFLEKYPNAQLDKNGTPCVCPDELGYCEGRYCKPNELDCVKCWDRPLEE